MKKGLLAVLSTIAGGAAGAAIVEKSNQKVHQYQKERIDKFYQYFQLLNQWMTLKSEGTSLVKYFEKNGYKNIAVYGVGELFNHLQRELRDSGINIVYGIDKKADKIYSDIQIVLPEDEWNQNIDAVVVTPIFMYDELEKMIMDKVECPVVSLEDVVYSI